MKKTFLRFSSIGVAVAGILVQYACFSNHHRDARLRVPPDLSTIDFPDGDRERLRAGSGVHYFASGCPEWIAIWHGRDGIPQPDDLTAVNLSAKSG
jgi:hypothetical protein